MILDGHVHMTSQAGDAGDLCDRMKQGGVDGGIILSMPPEATRPPGFGQAEASDERLDGVLARCAGRENLYPFFWIDPTEADALAQVSMAVERGVMGFKVICSRHYPGDPREMKTYRAIAEADKPILFHSGILWDGPVASSQYNRPAGFECMLEVQNSRFALAHISWPWCDELIAVYGKFRNTGGSSELFVDTTPGTPEIYRREALTKLFTVGYKVADNVFFGTDCRAEEYGADWAATWIDRDRQILTDIGLAPETIDAVFAGNLNRFLGISE